MKIVAQESDAFFYQGKTFLAAAAFLSVSDFKHCI